MEKTFLWLQDLGFATSIRESGWLFPTIETVHVFALVLVVGSIMTVDLRLLGVVNRDRPFTEVAAQTLPWTWTAFVVAASAGALMFASKAVTYYNNIPFRIKMICLLLAGLNMGLFHWRGLRRVAEWDNGSSTTAARAAGAASLLLWVVIVATGRWIGFTT